MKAALRWWWRSGAVLLLVAAAGCGPGSGQEPSHRAAAKLRVVVTDPLADTFACACAPPSSWRHYQALGRYLEGELGVAVQLVHAEHLRDGVSRLGGAPDLVIGKHHTVLWQAAEVALELRGLLRLGDRQGATTLKGLFVVRADDPAREVADLSGYQVLLGPKAAEEKHGAAMEVLRAAGVTAGKRPRIAQRCVQAALDVAEHRADAAVISSYAAPLLTSEKFFSRGTLRVIGETAPVPFITVFAGPGLDETELPRVEAALLAARDDPGLLAALVSRDGFVALGPEEPVSLPAGEPESK